VIWVELCGGPLDGMRLELHQPVGEIVIPWVDPTRLAALIADRIADRIEGAGTVDPDIDALRYTELRYQARSSTRGRLFDYLVPR
jgi:hypothetical protein